LHTESTTNIDSDEALSSSGRFDRSFTNSIYTPASHSRKSSNLYQSPSMTLTNGYSMNPLMCTQPIMHIESHEPAHSHTKSFDITSLPPPGNFCMYPQNYLCPTPGYFQNYSTGYVEGAGPEYAYDENMGYYYSHMQNIYYGESGMKQKGVRKKNPETEMTKPHYIINLEDILSRKDNRTTIMIRNIPNKYNQKMLLKKIDVNHKRLYDFFYLPIDFKNKCNVGYAFINFISPIYILKFYEEFNAHKWEKFNSEKVCQISYGRIQGKTALMQHFQSSSTICQQDKKVRPLILTAQGPSPLEMMEYEKKLKLTMTPEHMKELTKLNATVFGHK